MSAKVDKIAFKNKKNMNSFLLILNYLLSLRA